MNRTYAEWNSLGYHINKGAKKVGRNADGHAVFSPNQVHKSKRPRWAGRYTTSKWTDDGMDIGGPTMGLYGNCD